MSDRNADMNAPAETIIDRFNQIIDTVEARCMATDGPVTPTLAEMDEKELAELWRCVQGIRSTISCSSARFINALRIMWGLDRLDLLKAGVIDGNWGAPEASDRNHINAFMDDPVREIFRMPDANFERLFALIESRQPASRSEDALRTIREGDA